MCVFLCPPNVTGIDFFIWFTSVYSEYYGHNASFSKVWDLSSEKHRLKPHVCYYVLILWQWAAYLTSSSPQTLIYLKGCHRRRELIEMCVHSAPQAHAQCMFIPTCRSFQFDISFRTFASLFVGKADSGSFIHPLRVLMSSIFSFYKMNWKGFLLFYAQE